jgi:hypothetical protein
MVTVSSQASITRANSSSSTATTRKKNLAPASLQKQTQTVIVCNHLTCVSSLDQKKLAQVQQQLFDSNHGNPATDILPIVRDCLSCDQAFWLCGEK